MQAPAATDAALHPADSAPTAQPAAGADILEYARTFRTENPNDFAQQLELFQRAEIAGRNSIAIHAEEIHAVNADWDTAADVAFDNFLGSNSTADRSTAI